jgi:hypothetical protein
MSSIFPQQPAALDSYGGPKQDEFGVTNPIFQRSADEVNAAFKDAAAMTQTSIQARVSLNDTGTGRFVVSHRALWGDTALVIPTVTSVSAGVFNVVFPTTIVDALGQTIIVNLNAAFGNIQGSTFGFINVAKLTPNSVQVRLASTAGTANALTNSIIDIFVL